MLAGEKQLEIKVGDASAGTCTVVIKSHMENFADILDEVTNPVSFMCDAMGVPERSKESLDNDFVDRLTNGQSDPHTQLLTDNYRDKTGECTRYLELFWQNHNRLFPYFQGVTGKSQSEG